MAFSKSVVSMCVRRVVDAESKISHKIDNGVWYHARKIYGISAIGFGIIGGLSGLVYEFENAIDKIDKIFDKKILIKNNDCNLKISFINFMIGTPIFFGIIGICMVEHALFGVLYPITVPVGWYYYKNQDYVDSLIKKKIYEFTPLKI